MEAKELLESIFERCEILYNEEVIGQELLLKQFEAFINRTFNEKNHNVSVVLHTGSICFDIIALVFATISNIALNEEKVDSVVSSLYVGDYVVYNNKRYIFKGITERRPLPEMPLIRGVVLEQNNDTDFVPEKLWYKITPYGGDSKSLDGKGLRKKTNKKAAFISNMTGIKSEEIPSIIGSSTVIVMPKSKADDLLRNISIVDIKENMSYSLLDLATVSYYTEGGVINYSGNSEKTDPNLKITSKLSVARELIYNPDYNKVNGLIVLENDGANQSVTELEELLKRRSLKYVYATYDMISDIGQQVASNNEEANLFACTKEFLLQNSYPVKQYNAYTGALDRDVDYIIDKEVVNIDIESDLKYSEYRKLIKALLSIKRSDFLDENKEDFVIQSLSLINLFTTAPFSIAMLDNNSNLKGGLLSPYQKVELLEMYCNGFSQSLKEKATLIVDIIKRLYQESYNGSPKENTLKRLLTKARGEKIAVIIPKAYYESVLTEVLHIYMGTGKISFHTPNRFNNSNLYDRIIVLGHISGKRFNPFKCHSAKEIDVLLYSFEKNLYEYKRKEALRTERDYDRRLNLIDYDDPELVETIEEENAKEIEMAVSEVDDYIMTMNMVAIKNYMTGTSKGESGALNIVRIGKFSEGESILFSKNYKATVFNEEEGTVVEKDIKDLETGDILVFTKNDNVTKGIVDEILELLLDKGLLSEAIKNAYDKSRYWKTALKKYVDDNNISYEDLGKRMASAGSKKDYATIRTWIQPFSHIVGPRDVESYFHIAEVTGDKRMQSDPRSFWEACNVIRSERMMILRLIADAIVKKLGGKEEKDDKIFRTVYDNVENLSMRRQLDSIVDIDEEYAAPIGMVNRPIEL